MKVMTMAADEAIRKVLAEYGGLARDVSTLAPSDDLYRLGLTSHASINVMLGLEAAFDVEFLDTMLRKSTFESIGAIRSALVSLGVEGEE